MATTSASTSLTNLVNTIEVARSRIDSTVFGDHDIQGPEFENLRTLLGTLVQAAFLANFRMGQAVGRNQAAPSR